MYVSSVILVLAGDLASTHVPSEFFKPSSSRLGEPPHPDDSGKVLGFAARFQDGDDGWEVRM